MKPFDPCGAALGSSPRSNRTILTSRVACAISAWAFPEFGTVSLSELASVKGRLGLGIERELYFTAEQGDFGLHRGSLDVRAH